MPEDNKISIFKRPNFWLLVLSVVSLLVLIAIGLQARQTSQRLDKLELDQASQDDLSYYRTAGIGEELANDSFKLVVSRVDCSLASSQAGNKLCAVDITLTNTSNQTEALPDIFLQLSSRLESGSYLGQVQQKDLRASDSPLNQLEPEISYQQQLVFEVANHQRPYRLSVGSDDQQLRIFLDHYGNLPTDCWQDSSANLNGSLSDCNYQYSFDNFNCRQQIEVADQDYKVCLFYYSLTNISNQASLEPYIPNIPYPDVNRNGYWWWNRNKPHLIDADGNRYSRLTSNYYLSRTHPQIDLDDQAGHSTISLQPSQSVKINQPIVFVIPLAARPSQLSLISNPGYYYPVVNNAVDHQQTSSSTEATSSDCPTCRLND